jgi:hypothetical protein
MMGMEKISLTFPYNCRGKSLEKNRPYSGSGPPSTSLEIAIQ